MQVKYSGNPRDPNDSKVAELFGETFFLDQVVDVSHLAPEQRRKLAGNPCFTVVVPDAEAPEPEQKPRKTIR